MIVTSVRALLLFTAITGALYPLLLTGVAQTVFPKQAAGSLLVKNGVVVGSQLIAYKVEDPKLFWFRPSGADYATVASGATNQSPASRAFQEAVGKRRASLGTGAPADLLTTSGSGLDPHVSPAAAEFQIPRVAQARKLSPRDTEVLRQLVRTMVERKTWGILGQERVNVGNLNLAVEDRFPEKR